jgi:hypothetical protein
MEAILMKVTPSNKNHQGCYVAKSVGKFDLIWLRFDLNSVAAMFENSKFTEVYFRTSSGNIYKIFQEKDNLGHPDKWALVNKNNPKYKYYFVDAEMFYGWLKLDSMFYYGNNGCTSEVTEIVCVKSDQIRFNISNDPEAKLVQEFNN